MKKILTKKVIDRLDREIYGLLCDLDIAQQRTDEFVDQEKLVERFMTAWRKVVEKLRKKAIAQVKKGKTDIKL